MKRIYAGIIALVLACIGLVAAGTAASASNANQTDYWEAKYPNAVACYKNTHGTKTNNNKAVTLPVFDPSWPGDRWEVLIVKGGSAGGDGNGNAVYELPSAGAPYYAPLNGGGKQPDVSHWIVCKGEAPVVVDEPDAKADIGLVPATCESGARLEYTAGNATNATFSGTASGTVGPANYSVTATADTGHTFGDGSKTQVFTGSLAGAIGFQTADSTLPCFNRPTLPEPTVTTEEDVKSVCTQPLDGTVTVTTKTRTVTTPKIWNETVKEYVDGDKVYGEWTTTVKTQPSDKCDAPTPTPTPTETVTPTPTPSVTTPGPSPSASETPVVTEVGTPAQLAATGSNGPAIGIVALVLVLAGTVALLVARRRSAQN